MAEIINDIPHDLERYRLWSGTGSPDLQKEIETTEKIVIRNTGSKLMARIVAFEKHTEKLG